MTENERIKKRSSRSKDESRRHSHLRKSGSRRHSHEEKGSSSRRRSNTHEDDLVIEEVKLRRWSSRQEDDLGIEDFKRPGRTSSRRDNDLEIERVKHTSKQSIMQSQSSRASRYKHKRSSHRRQRSRRKEGADKEKDKTSLKTGILDAPVNNDLKKDKSGKAILETTTTTYDSASEFSSRNETHNCTMVSESQKKIFPKMSRRNDNNKKCKNPWHSFLFNVFACIAGLFIISFVIYELTEQSRESSEAAIATPVPTSSIQPSLSPSMSMMPSTIPSLVPSSNPSMSKIPTPSPSEKPSISNAPSAVPSQTSAPSQSFLPTASFQPSSEPSLVPSMFPSESQLPTWTPISTNYDFKVRLQWEYSYRWQEEWTERFWCLECVRCEEYGRGDGWMHGCVSYGSGNNGNCRDGDSIWIRDCRSRGNRFNVLQNDQASFMLRLDNTKLCIERRNKHLMFRRCDKNEIDQQFVPWFDWSKFELRPLVMKNWSERAADCVSQLHHPKQDEVVGMHNCRESRLVKTLHWERYN